MSGHGTFSRSALLACLLVAGCVNVPASRGGIQNVYVLDAAPAVTPSAVKRDLVLAVGMPQARPGFETSQIVYFRQPYQLDYFADSGWTDTPAHMLQPLLLQALQQSAGFRAVVEAGSMIAPDIRLDTEVIRLQQDFTTKPSRVEFALQAQLINVRSDRVLATRQFDDAENADKDDAYGGVVAANRLVRRVLGKVAEFCVEASANR